MVLVSGIILCFSLTETVKQMSEILTKHSLFLTQTARWKVTSKEALQRIGEYSEAAITIRGTYFPPGKEPKEGERKIYLAIESTCQFLCVN